MNFGEEGEEEGEGRHYGRSLNWFSLNYLYKILDDIV
jgi:hypothetical protein